MHHAVSGIFVCHSNAAGVRLCDAEVRRWARQAFTAISGFVEFSVLMLTEDKSAENGTPQPISSATHGVRPPAHLMSSRFLLAVYAFLATGTLGHLLVGVGLWAPAASIVRLVTLIYGYWLAVTFVVFQIGLGERVLRLRPLRSLEFSLGERWVFGYAIGSYLTYSLLLGLGLVGYLRSEILAGYVVVAIACSLFFLFSFEKSLAGVASGQSNAGRPWPLWLRAAWIVAALAWVAPYFVQTLLPSTDADGVMYHLPLADRFLERSVWDVDPYFPAFNFVGAISLFYSLFLSVGAEQAVLPFSFLCGLLTLAAVYLITTRFWGRTAGFWAALFAVSMNVVWEVALTPRVDVQLSLYFLLATFAFLLWREKPENTSCLWLLGAMVGMMLGIKYTAVVFAAIFAVAVLWTSLRVRRRLVRPLIICLLLALVPSSYWYARNWVRLGDPLYPMLWHTKMYVDDHGDIRPFSELVASQAIKEPTPNQLDESLADMGMSILQEPVESGNPRPRHSLNLLALILAPHWYEMNPFHTVTPYVLLCLLVPFVARDERSVLLFAIAAASYVALGYQHWVVRYVLPALALILVGSGIAVAEFVQRDNVQRSTAVRVAMTLLCILVALYLLRDWIIVLTVHPATQGIERALPLTATFALGIATLLLPAVARQRPSTRFAKSLITITAGLLIVIVARDWTCELVKLAARHPAGYLLGRESRLEYLQHAEGTGITRVAAFIQERVREGIVEPDATILMLGEYKGRYLGVDYLPDDNFNGYRWRVEVLKSGGDPEALRNRLLRQGIRYILIHHAQIAWFHTGEPRLFRASDTAFALHHVHQLTPEHGRVIYDRAGIRLVRVQ